MFYFNLKHTQRLMFTFETDVRFTYKYQAKLNQSFILHIYTSQSWMKTCFWQKD